MPSIMSLEGPRVRPLGQIRGQLYAAAPRPFWRAQAQLSGVLDPFTAHPWIFLLGLVGGAVYAAKRKKKG